MVTGIAMSTAHTSGTVKPPRTLKTMTAAIHDDQAIADRHL
jgi:hypothetical protein